MSRWFRSYADAHRNPKVARLSDSDFRLWHQLLCMASENDGVLPPAEDIKLMLNRRLDHLLEALKRLISGGLIEPLGDGYAPRNWNKRQYKSDTSTPRVKAMRAKRNVSETPPDTETETEVSVAKATSAPPAVLEEKKRAIASCLKVAWPCPDGVEDAHWRDFMAARKRKRCVETQTALDGVMADLARIADDEWPLGRLVQHAAAKGWGSINDPREPRHGQSSGNVTSLQRNRPNLTALLRASSGDPESGFGTRPALPASGNG